METVAGIVVLILSVPCWGGQVMSVLAPSTAQRLGLMEREQEVEEIFWADVRGEAQGDLFTLWTLPAAGILMLGDHASWPYFGLVGGGMYLYFGLRGIAVRRILVAEGRRSIADVKVAYAALAVWTLLGAVVIIASALSLAD